MKRRKTVDLPRDVYPVDPWRIVETRFYPRFVEQTETIFSLANGYLGLRGSAEEGEPVFENGTYISGFYETWPICYGETAPGFPADGQTIVNVTDTKPIRLEVDGETFVAAEDSLLEFQRVLDLRTGLLDREVLWRTPSGRRVRIRSERLVSYAYPHLAAIAYAVSVEGGEAEVVVRSGVNNDDERRLREGDPRLHHAFKRRVLLPRLHRSGGMRVVLAHVTEKSGLALACGIDHRIEGGEALDASHVCGEQQGEVVFRRRLGRGETLTLTKFMAYHTGAAGACRTLARAVDRSLDFALAKGFDHLRQGQKRRLDAFWARADVQLEGGGQEWKHRAAEMQQALRFNMFQIYQATARAGDRGIPAKGLTGQAYDGNCFWDAEAYVLPFLAYTLPGLARNVLNFRWRTLDKARQRAIQVNAAGALFPWRTINGEEVSAYYAAGTAQYHIDGDIARAVERYAKATGDEVFLFGRGAQLLVETARMWLDLGFYSRRRQGRFCIHGVTGPDEYTTVVDNNFYTNCIAKNNLAFAADTLERLRETAPRAHAALVLETGLGDGEPEAWRQAADAMYLPYDRELGVHPQDDTFLEKEPWDFAGTPDDHYPLLLHYHPLVIYRRQVLKQADVGMALLHMADWFTLEQKRRDFEYYDPLTTGDSSLSWCVQGILALEAGYVDMALGYAHGTVLMDLGDMEGNVKDGCHIASLAGSWMLCVYGLGGMREHEDGLSFAPSLPRGLTRLGFRITFQNALLELTVGRESVVYRLIEGEGMDLWHGSVPVRLDGERREVELPLPAAGSGAGPGSV